MDGYARDRADQRSKPLLEDQFLDLIDPVLKPLGLREEEGEEFREPPLDVLRYYRRPVRLHWLPLIGRAQAVVAVVRQPVDVGLTGSSKDYRAFLARLSMAINGRFPPGSALGWGSIGLTVIVLTPEPIAAEDDALMKTALEAPTRSRVVPLGLVRVNLGQEAMAFQLAGSPDGLFPEPVAIADALTLQFRRFVPLFDGT
jgi:hypothetical protein